MEVLISLGSDEMRQRHYRYIVVHSTEYATVVDATLASVVDDDDGDFLVLDVPPSLRGSVEIGSLGGTPNPRL